MDKTKDTTDQKHAQLTERECEILFEIVEQHIRHCEPVGSRSLSKSDSVKLSPATIRNTMSDLSEKGYLSQSHVSAGRVPTDEGYRLYVNRLRSKINTSANAAQVRNLYNSVPDHLDLLLKATVSILSDLTKMACLITYPNMDDSSVGAIEFLPLNDKQTLAVLVTRAGMVCHKIINQRETLDSQILQNLSSYLNTMFVGMNIGAVKERLFESFLQDHEQSEQLAKALRLGKQVFEISNAEASFMSGQENIFNWPEFSDHENLKRVYMLLEQRQHLVDLLQKSRQAKKNNPGPEDVDVLIGKESAVHELAQCAIVSTGYGTREHTLGSIGILGPMRMDYDKIIPLVSETSKVLSSRIHHIAIQGK